MNRLDTILADYEKEREAAKTLEEFIQAARKLVERIDHLPGDKTQLERWIRSLFAKWS